MGKVKDDIWKYAKELKGSFLCNFCGREYSGGSTRIKSHLAGVRGRDIKICPEVPEDVQLEARQAISPPKKKAGNLRCLNNDGESEVISTSSPNKKVKSLHQPTILGERKKDKSVLDKMITKFIISNNIPHDFATMQCLVDLLRSVAEFGPSYVPNTSALTSRLIPDMFYKVEEYVGKVKKLFTTTGCTLVMYNVEGNDECYNVFAYTPAVIIYVGKIEVPEQGMTFSDFNNNICSIIESLGPENVVQCFFNFLDIGGIIDNVDDFSVPFEDMIRMKYPWIFLHTNADETVTSILSDIYLVPWIWETTKLAAVIFRYLHKHDFNLLPQRDHTSNIKVYCRVAIGFFVLRTILEVEKELQAMQLPIATESCEWPSREKNDAEIVHEAIHSTKFWTRCKKVVQVLRSLFQFGEFIDGKGSNFGYLYEATKRIEEAIKQQCDGDDQFHCEKIIESFEDWKMEQIKPLHAAAAFLNPAYFCSENFTEDTHEMRKGLHHLNLLVPTEEQEALSKELQLYRTRMPDLFSVSAKKMLNTIHPGKWWECFGAHCPILQKLAVRILSQPCSPPLFPEPVDVQSNDGDDELRMNMILMENFGTVKSQNLEPIRLFSEQPDYAYEYVFKTLGWVTIYNL